MTVEERILNITLLEQMAKNKEFARKLGLKDQSKFKGRSVSDTDKNKK